MENSYRFIRTKVPESLGLGGPLDRRGRGRLECGSRVSSGTPSSIALPLAHFAWRRGVLQPSGYERASRGWVAILAVTLLAGCRGPLELAPNDADEVLSRQLLEAPDPGRRGPHAVRTLYYGSGTDRNRPEYRDSVTYVTEPVDASKLVDLGSSAESRNDYWGFEPDRFPLNARVWYPVGDGPFPLVLVVHGNHNMRDFSDPGYDYLGELLASRGYILASVDMNFINGGIRGENDARGWFLLQHVGVWKGFNDDEDNLFHGRVDLERIALIGHSRGGEAVGHAAAFNRLDRYPDDATLEFDFDYDIRAIIAIAPVDGQYLPTDRFVPVENVNYMVFHGSHDGDVTSFHGLRLYKRVKFTDGQPRLKTALWVYRANHGQWNTVWGAHDNGPRSGRILDLRALMPGEDQRRFAEVYVSAFLETTLRDDKRYLPMFRDHRVIGGWLPKTMYVTRLQTESFRTLADFEEDIDVTSGTHPGVRLRGDSLSTWREGRMGLRSSNRAETSASQDNQAVWLGWNNRIAGADTLGPAAAYTIELPGTLASEWELGADASLELSLAVTRGEPGPRSAGDDADDPGEEPGDSGEERSDSGEEDGDEEPPDLSVVARDGRGTVASVPLSRYGPVRKPLEMRVLRRRDLEDDRFANLFELLLQSYSIPLADFVAAAPGLRLEELTEVGLVFDRTVAGEVVLDDVAFARMDPAYTAVRVP